MTIGETGVQQTGIAKEKSKLANLRKSKLWLRPIPVAEQSKGRVYGRLLAVIEGSNPSGGMHVYVWLVLCVVR